MTHPPGLVRIAWTNLTLGTAVAASGALSVVAVSALGRQNLLAIDLTDAVAFLCVSAAAVYGGLMLSRRTEMRGYASASPLTDSEAVLAAEATVKRRVLARNLLFVVFLTVTALAIGRLIGGDENTPMVLLCVHCTTAAIFLLRSMRIRRWERRHGVTLWMDSGPSRPDPVTRRRSRAMPPLFTTPR